ncbi:hypothetical protein [uncultured Thiodictyon sp.]|uniref:hypothetical protein n=1 Tax=uncultured Thiodictyon sp. TaxID=1846217 RepID=UPI0025E504B5|nr:hypothetical protein [uncultured Thiodictyon sp.]
MPGQRCHPQVPAPLAVKRKEDDTLHRAPALAGAFDGGPAHAWLLAVLVIDKFLHHLPQ